MKSILFVSSDNNRYSGAFLSMVQLALHLQNDFFYTVSIVLPCGGTGSSLLNDKGLKYHIVENYDWVKPVSLILSEKYKKKEADYKKNRICEERVRVFLHKSRPDIVHINTSWCYLFGKVAQEEKIPVVWHIREFLEEDQNMMFIDKKFSISLFKRASRVICVSNKIAEKYALEGLSNLSVIYNGIDEKKLSIGCKNHVILRNRIKRFVCVGSLGNAKGQPQLVEWFGKLSIDHVLHENEYELILVGKYGETTQKIIREIADKYHIEKNIIITGPIDDQLEIYKDKDILIVNSKCEAFGRTTVEAMMANVLVLGANTGGTPELIEDRKTGLLFESCNYDKFKEKIRMIVEDIYTCQRISNEGRNYAISHFTSLENARRIQEIYCTILKKGES